MIVVTSFFWGGGREGADCPRPTETIRAQICVLFVNELQHILRIQEFWDEKIHRYSQVVFLDTCGTETTDDEGSLLLRNISKRYPSGVGAHSRSKRIFNRLIYKLIITYGGPSLF